MKTFYIKISGKVQGVFFRAEARDVAIKFSVAGWIKNTAAGNVEALVSGESEQLNKFIEWCNKGPAGAHVADILVTEQPFQTFKKFTIIK